jgi:hypothetical protein
LTADAYTFDSLNNLESDRRNSRGNPLAFLANGTGGFAISGGEDLREPFRRLIADIDTYYEAEYAPVSKDYDGRFHSIDVQPTRAGVTIRSRAGYFALAPEAAGSFSVRPFEVPLLKILSDSPLPVDVGFQQAILRLGGKSGRTENEVAIEVPLSHLELRPDEHPRLYSAHISIVAQVRDKAGVVVERFSQDVSRNGALETIEAARTDTVTMQRHFTAAPGNYVLESTVLDRLSGKAGAQRTEFTIPSPDPGPWLSDIVLVRRTEPFGGAPDPLEPMQYAKARVVPNLSQQIPAGTPRISFFFTNQSDPSPVGHDGKLDLDLEKDGAIMSHTSMDMAPSSGEDSNLNLATIQTKTLVPGSYRAVFAYSQGGKSFSRDVAFTVDGNRQAGDESAPGPTDQPGKDDAKTPSESASSAGSPPHGLLEIAPDRFSPATSDRALQRPSEDYLHSLLSSARERALGYVDSLVNFRCVEVTDRFIDPKGTGNWTKRDKIAEMVTYENRAESRTILEVNGQPGKPQPIDLKGARLEGEYGGVLKTVFDPASKAEFKWEETDLQDGAAAQVFSYRVDAKNSKYTVAALPKEPITVGFHGLVYIDDARRGVLRITMEADGLPARYPVHASAIAIDYDYVAISNHDYLMPVQGEMRMKVGKLEDIRHDIEFRDYHRFGSESRILSVAP